jgi:outer membrane protein OmpA-like peptidoglycan-associated protein
MSMRRAGAAKAYLVAHGVSASMVRIRPPAAAEALVQTEIGVREAQNRFVAIRIVR